ncbi:MAG: nitroreductase family protein [Chloroflexota bacterium]
MLSELIVKNRSYRRFHQEVPIPRDTLRELVDLARLSASGANRQPLKYVLSCDAQRNALVFSHITTWAAYLRDWEGPQEGERPSAYIVILCDTEVNKTAGIDPGIAAQSILLGATEKGLGGCIIGSVHKEQLREVLKIDPRNEILYVLALGKPKETVVVEPVGPDGDIKYWHDAQGGHHVPKRSLDEIIVG